MVRASRFTLVSEADLRKVSSNGVFIIFAFPIVARCLRLGRTPFHALSQSDLQLLISQKIGLKHMVPKAMKSVSEDALLEAEPSLGSDSIRTEKGSSGPLLCRFETCRAGLTMSVRRGRPEVAGLRSRRREWTHNRHHTQSSIGYLLSRAPMYYRCNPFFPDRNLTVTRAGSSARSELVERSNMSNLFGR